MARHAVATSGGAVATAEKQEGRRAYGTFHALQYRDFRLQWLGQCGAAASMWMEQIARPLLILHLTDSSLLLGLVAATRMLPMLLVGIWAGVIADRVDKRRILMVVQSTTFATHFVTGVLILTGAIEPWMVFVGTFVAGSAMAFNQPARQSFIPRLVPAEALSNAVALNSTAVNVMRTAGPAIAGLILAAFDFGELYMIQAALYVWVIFWTLQISVRTRPGGGGRAKTSMLADLKEGFAAVKRDPPVMYLLLLSLTLFIWGMPYQSVFVPLLAKKVLDVGDVGAGAMISMVGIGGLTGALALATIGGSLRRRGLVMLVIIAVYAVGLMLLSRAELLLLAMPALFVTGAMQTAYMSITHAFVLERTQPELQGRIMSLFSLDRGLIPMGAALAGVFAATLGPQNGLLLMGAICLGSLMLAVVLLPSLRKM